MDCRKICFFLVVLVLMDYSLSAPTSGDTGGQEAVARVKRSWGPPPPPDHHGTTRCCKIRGKRVCGRRCR